MCVVHVHLSQGVVGWGKGNGYLSVPGHPTSLDISKARVFCAFIRRCKLASDRKKSGLVKAKEFPLGISLFEALHILHHSW